MLTKYFTETTKSLLPFDAPLSFNGYPYQNNSDEYLGYEHRNSLVTNNKITDWQTLSMPEQIKDIGIIERIGFITENGYPYSAIIGVPDSPSSNVPVIGTSAWTTSTEGHNEHTIRNFMKAGNYVFFVGAEGSYHPRTKPNPKGPITLADSASATLNFSKQVGRVLKEQGHPIDLQKRIAIGESRGGMVGMGLIALAEEFDQEIIMADFAAPCLPRRLEKSDTLKFAEQIAREPGEIIRLAGKLTLARLVHYPETIDPSPYSLKHQFAIGFALFSGEAGPLAKNIPENSVIHITVFNNDIASMRKEWEEIFQNHPNVRITPLPGSHMTIADLETMQFALARNRATQNCINNSLELNQQNIFDSAHQFVK